MMATPHWTQVLEWLGFDHIEGCLYRWQGQDFDFTSRQSTDAITAEIWDRAQHYGEHKREQEIKRRIFGV